MKTVAKTEADPQQRPPLQRMLHIHESIQTGTYPSAASLARELEVSRKTIHRDLEFMRSRLDLPILYEADKFGFRYSEKVKAFPTLQITEGELLGLVIAEKALNQYRGTNLEKPLLSAIKKIEQSLPDMISMSLGDMQKTISFRTSAEPILDLSVFNEIAKATAKREQLEISYRKPGQKDPDRRIVDPYHLANINGEWYLFAFDHLRNDIRTFVPTRVKELKRTGKTFRPPEKFSLEKRLRDSFGVHSPEGQFDVVLRFSERVADYLREKKWHESQRLKECKKGGVEVQMKLSSLKEVERWVLSWGGDAVVLRPKELADSVKVAAKRILESYKKPT